MNRLMFAALILGWAVSDTSTAAIFVNHPDSLFFASQQTAFDLDNYENLVKAPGNVGAGIEVGDSLRGIFTIISSNTQGGGNATLRVPGPFELTGIFDALVNRVEPIGVGGNAIFELVPNPTFEATYGTGAMISFFYDTTPDFSAIADGTIGTPVTGTEALATDGSLYMVLGATGDWGDVNSDGDGYFWAAAGAITPGVAAFAASLDLLTNNTGLPDSFFLDLTQVPPNHGADPLDPADVYTNESALGSILNPFALQGNTSPNDLGATSPYVLDSNDPLRALVTPEPTAIITWGLLIFGAAGVAVVRRRCID